MNDQAVHIYGEHPVRSVLDTDTRWGSLSVRKKNVKCELSGASYIYS